MPSICDCNANCYHHKGKPCSLEPEELSSAWVVDSEEFEGNPIRLSRCLLCILEEERRRRAIQSTA
jgi:hypothetical protein